MTDAFYWIGVAVVSVVSVGITAFAVIWLHFKLLHNRFNSILFRKSDQRLSIASWHNTRLLRKGEDAGSLERWPADDWPINDRPLYLSLRIGERRIFILFGILDRRRDSSIEGTHP